MVNINILGFWFLLKWLQIIMVPWDNLWKMVQIANGYGKNILGASLIISLEHVDGSEKLYQKKVL